MKYLTGEVCAFDPEVHPPPRDTKINLITKYGIQTIGFWDDESYIAWYPLLKIPASVKERLKYDKFNSVQSA